MISKMQKKCKDTETYQVKTATNDKERQIKRLKYAVCKVKHMPKLKQREAISEASKS